MTTRKCDKCGERTGGRLYSVPEGMICTACVSTATIAHRYWYTFDFRDTRAAGAALMGWCFGVTEDAAKKNARNWASRHRSGPVLDQITSGRVYLNHCTACACVPSEEKRL